MPDGTGVLGRWGTSRAAPLIGLRTAHDLDDLEPGSFVLRNDAAVSGPEEGAEAPIVRVAHVRGGDWAESVEIVLVGNYSPR